MNEPQAMAVEIEGIPFDSVGEAIQYANAAGRGVVVSVEGIDGCLLVERQVADAIEASGASFAYYYEREMPDGSWRIVSVPAND